MYKNQKLPPSDSPRKYLDMNQIYNIMNEEKWNENTQELTTNLLNSILETQERIDYVKTFNKSCGFMFSEEKIHEQIVLDSKDYENHSGCSLACTFRNCQYILNKFDFDDNETVKNNMYDESIDLGSEPDIEFTNDINTDSVKGKASSYPLYHEMDKNNQNIMDIAANDGIEEAVKQMFIDPNNPNGKLTYAQMRDLYG